MLFNIHNIIAKAITFAMMFCTSRVVHKRIQEPAGISCKSIGLNSSYQLVRKDNNQLILIRNSLE